MQKARLYTIAKLGLRFASNANDDVFVHINEGEDAGVCSTKYPYLTILKAIDLDTNRLEPLTRITALVYSRGAHGIHHTNGSSEYTILIDPRLRKYLHDAYGFSDPEIAPIVYHICDKCKNQLLREAGFAEPDCNGGTCYFCSDGTI
jgi:hypothetical protein